jgi:hypothetical protein
MEKGIHKIGDMLFEEFNNLSYQEQCDYISTLKPIVVENLENQGKEYIQIDTTIEEYIQQYNLISFDELRTNIKDIENKSNEIHGTT